MFKRVALCKSLRKLKGFFLAVQHLAQKRDDLIMSNVHPKAYRFVNAVTGPFFFGIRRGHRGWQELEGVFLSLGLAHHVCQRVCSSIKNRCSIADHGLTVFVVAEGHRPAMHFYYAAIWTTPHMWILLGHPIHRHGRRVHNHSAGSMGKH